MISRIVIAFAFGVSTFAQASSHLPIEFKQASAVPNYTAPDGLEVYLGAETNTAGDAGVARFEAPIGFTGKAVTHKTVDEVWYCLDGQGQIAIKNEAKGEWRVFEMTPGASISLPLGAHFQVRNIGSTKLKVLGVTTPRWPNNPEEAVVVAPLWQPTGLEKVDAPVANTAEAE